MIHSKKIGILGGGQLGRMFLQEATRLDLDLYFMDKGFDFPVPRIFPQFVLGNFTAYDDVMAFGKTLDIISIEIENVNTAALNELESMGKEVYPQPAVISIIKDKGKQKDFYIDHDIPTSTYKKIGSAEEILAEIESGHISYPFVQKSREAGYDGKGVAVIRSQTDHNKIIDAPSIIEELIDIDKELAIIIARNPQGETTHFDVTEMVFNETGNLLDHLICPSAVSENIKNECLTLADKLIKDLDMVGILAVEFFLTKDGKILVNECAPRPHNSGHHTIDACNYSQFHIHMRSILSLPLPVIKQSTPSVMYNLLGEGDHAGPVSYEGMKETLAISEVYIHLYGKQVCKPLRKMGHVNIMGDSQEELMRKLNLVKKSLKVKACESV